MQNLINCIRDKYNIYVTSNINTDDRPLRRTLHRPVRYSPLVASQRLRHYLVASHLLIYVTTVEVCDATTADSSTAVDKKNKITSLNISS